MIAFDASAYGDVFPGTSVNYNHTCSGTNRILFVTVINGTSASTITVTYNGVSMTQIGSAVQANGSTRFISLFYLIAPATGTNVIHIASTINDLISAASCSYTGARQSSQPDNSTTNSNNGTSPITTGLTINTGASWTLLAIHSEGGGTAAGTGSFLRQSNNDFSSPTIFDSNAGEMSGTYNMTVTSTSTTGNGIIMISFAPAPLSANGQFLAFI